MAPSQPVFAGRESRGESKEKTLASLGEREHSGDGSSGVPRTAPEAGMLKSNARQSTEKKSGTGQRSKGTWMVVSGKTE